MNFWYRISLFGIIALPMGMILRELRGDSVPEIELIINVIMMSISGLILIFYEPKTERCCK